jgi:rhodanese-related sulfurtransferase
MHTPGHRPELVSLLLVDPDRGPDPLAVLTGDSLLVGDAGRPDFDGGDAAAQHRSVARLLALPDWVQVLPGHVEGPCGAGMTGAASSTIGYERRYNPLARLDRDAFVARLAAAIPPRPLNQTAIEATNRGLAEMPWAMLTGSPAVREAAVADLVGRRHGALLIDVREPGEFDRGHVPGALNVPLADLAGWQRGAPRDRDLLLICQSGRRSRQAAQFLIQCGIARVASVAGGTQAWADAGQPLAVGEPVEPARGGRSVGAGSPAGEAAVR